MLHLGGGVLSRKVLKSNTSLLGVGFWSLICYFVCKIATLVTRLNLQEWHADERLTAFLELERVTRNTRDVVIEIHEHVGDFKEW